MEPIPGRGPQEEAHFAWEIERIIDDAGNVVGLAGYLRNPRLLSPTDLFAIFDSYVCAPIPPKVCLVSGEEITQVTWQEMLNTNDLVDRAMQVDSVVVTTPVLSV